MLGVFATPIQTVFAQAPSPATVQSLQNMVARAQADRSGTQTTLDTGCNPLWGFNAEKCFHSFLAVAMYAIMKVAAWVLWVAGIFFNTTIIWTVVNMRDALNNVGGITDAWRVIRDLGNMMFIFVLLYAAIGTVLDLSSVSAKKIVTNVVIAALFINFSMFFTKVVIDASNILALGFYEAIAQSNPNIDPNSAEGGISAAFQSAFGVQSLYKAAESIQALQRLKDGWAIVVTGIAGFVIMLIAAFVLFAMAFAFAIRFVVLVFVLILSPIAFVSFAVPSGKLKGYANKWRDALFNQALFAPIFFILMWVVLRILTGQGSLAAYTNYGAAAQTNAMAALSDGNAGAVYLLFKYAISVAFIVAAFIISKQTASAGAGALSGVINKTTGWAGAATFGTVAYAGRQSLGRWANAGANDKKLQEEAARGNRDARLRLAINKKLASASFDARATGVGRTLDAGTGGVMGIGALNKGGYAATKKASSEKEKEWAQLRRQTESKKALDEGIAATKDLESGRTLSPTEREAALVAQNKMRRELQNLDTKGIEELGKDKLKDKFVAQNLTAKQFGALVTSKETKFTPEDVESFKKARYGDMYDALEKAKTGTFATPAEKEAAEKKATELVQAINPEELRHVDQNYFEKKEFVERLSSKQHESITKPENAWFTKDQKAKISELKYQSVKDALAPGPAFDPKGARQKFVAIPAKSKAKLDPAILTNPEIVETYNEKSLTAMAPDLPEGVKTQIRAAVKEELKKEEDKYKTDSAKSGGTVLGPDGKPTGKKLPEGRRLQRLRKVSGWLEDGAGSDLF